MEAEWYLKVADKEVGPLSSRQLKAMAESGRISAFDPVRRGSDGAWVPASSVKGLFPTGESSAEKSAPGRMPVARKLEEPPAAPKGKPASEMQPGAASAKRRSRSVPKALPVGQPGAAMPGDPPPGPPSPGGIRIETGADTPVARVAGRRSGGPAKVTKRRRNNVIVVVIVVLLVGLTAVGGGLMLSQKGAATASKDRDDAAGPAAVEGEPERDEVEIPGLDEYLGEAGPKSPQDAASEVPVADEWTDASKSPVQCGDVTVKITSAQVGRPRLIHRSSGRAARPKNDCLALSLELYNKNKAKKLEYTSWNVLNVGVTLVDNHKNEYSMKSFAAQGAEIDGQVEGGKGSLYPQEVTQDVLVFEKPAKTATSLRLQLPAAAFGEKGSLKFKIPAAMITVAAEPEEESEPGRPAQVAGRAVDPEAGVSPGREVPAISRGIEETDAAPAAAKRDDREGAQDRAAGQEGDDAPIAIPGITGQSSDDDGKEFSFEDDPKLQKAREDLRRQQEKENRAGGARNRSKK